ncbi:MAG TPA: ribosome biogenesis factor YjgA [Polyangiaceae bacterium]|nr:ribosome biogenesis factor YjgA [Polyangiaceae bacterium]
MTAVPLRATPRDMRKLSDRLREQAKAEADDRDLTSRSDLRREQNARETQLKRLAVALVRLTPKQLERLQLHELLLESITHAQALSNEKAKNRQIGVVRQHLRDEPDDARELRERLEALKDGLLPSLPPAPTPRANEAIEAWIERFIAEGDSAFDEFFATYPEADRQQLRQGTRAVARARDTGVATPAARRAEQRLHEELARWV